MNVKEAFRYQAFLEQRFNEAVYSVEDRSHAFIVTKKHLRSKANPDAEDKTEDVTTEDFFKNDDVIALMKVLIAQRGKLGEAISKAKAKIPFDLDSAISANRFRQRTVKAINSMLRSKGNSKTERYVDYKFNAEGNQVPYYYDVEVDYTEAFDRQSGKRICKDLSQESDTVSADVDAAMINTQVDYDPPFDVNGSFEDVMNEFLSYCAEGLMAGPQ